MCAVSSEQCLHHLSSKTSYSYLESTFVNIGNEALSTCEYRPILKIKNIFTVVYFIFCLICIFLLFCITLFFLNVLFIGMDTLYLKNMYCYVVEH